MTMNVKTICGGLLASLLLVALPSRAEPEMARLRYGERYQMQRVQSDLSNAYTNLVVVLRMEPASTDIAPTNVIVYIDVKSGKIPLICWRDGIEDLWQKWGQPDIWRLPHGHVGVCCGFVPGLTGRVLRWLSPRMNK